MQVGFLLLCISKEEEVHGRAPYAEIVHSLSSCCSWSFAGVDIWQLFSKVKM
jgi:hypothetical protein